MKYGALSLLLCLSLFFIASCSATLTPVFTFTPAHPETKALLPISTSSPTATSISFTATPTPHLPLGTPVPDWQGIPIMPGAIAGEYVNNLYRYITNASPDEVYNYYKKELILDGWKTSKTMPSKDKLFFVHQDKSMFNRYGYNIYLGTSGLLSIYITNGFTCVDVFYQPKP